MGRENVSEAPKREDEVDAAVVNIRGHIAAIRGVFQAFVDERATDEEDAAAAQAAEEVNRQIGTLIDSVAGLVGQALIDLHTIAGSAKRNAAANERLVELAEEAGRHDQLRLDRELGR